MGSEIIILKANGRVKEKGMCLKDEYMGGGAVGAGVFAFCNFAIFGVFAFCNFAIFAFCSFCQICAKSPFLPQMSAFLCLQPPHVPVSPASLSNSLSRLCNKSVRAVALSLHGILC